MASKGRGVRSRAHMHDMTVRVRLDRRQKGEGARSMTTNSLMFPSQSIPYVIRNGRKDR